MWNRSRLKHRLQKVASNARLALFHLPPHEHLRRSALLLQPTQRQRQNSALSRSEPWLFPSQTWQEQAGRAQKTLESKAYFSCSPGEGACPTAVITSPNFESFDRHKAGTRATVPITPTGLSQVPVSPTPYGQPCPTVK